jgi:hypothetical protein
VRRARREVKSGSFKVAEPEDGETMEALTDREEGIGLLEDIGGLGRGTVEDATGVDVRLAVAEIDERLAVACAETSLFDIAFFARVEVPDPDLLFLALDRTGGLSRTTMVRSLRLECSASVALRTLSATS